MYTFGNNKTVKIPSTLKIISDCWDNAEVDLQREISTDYPAVNEEFITQMFHGKFAKQLRIASEDHRVMNAFLKDLKAAYPDLQHGPDLKKISNGLIADVTLHKRETEKVTGGDIGLVIIRPKVNKSGYILKVGKHKRGILCQAKLKRSSGKWGKFTSNQIKVLANRLEYLGLLLYSYQDKERRELHQFSWQLCNSANNINEVSDWLKKDNYPKLVNSSTIINGIGSGKIGTDDRTTIDDIVAPVGNTVLEIRIGWPKDTPPPSEVRIHTNVFQKQQIKQKAYIRTKY